MSRGAFYASFANKGALLLDLMRRTMATEPPHWLRLADESVDVQTALRGMDERALSRGGITRS